MYVPIAPHHAILATGGSDWFRTSACKIMSTLHALDAQCFIQLSF
jgi:hypothetical protein